MKTSIEWFKIINNDVSRHIHLETFICDIQEDALKEALKCVDKVQCINGTDKLIIKDRIKKLISNGTSNNNG
jgi:hypothetical protein